MHVLCRVNLVLVCIRCSLLAKTTLIIMMLCVCVCVYVRAFLVPFQRDELGYLLLLDSGDLIEGTGLSDATPVHGEFIWPLVKQIPYSALTMGNHEIGVDSSIEELEKNFVPHWNGRYLTANTKVG
jgi:2',3'-cyclic-nucleotide 2'-phosphodiesterase (5'-nucleotidase family)